MDQKKTKKDKTVLLYDQILRSYDDGNENEYADEEEEEEMDTTDVHTSQTPTTKITSEDFSPVRATPSRQFIDRQNASQVIGNFGNAHNYDWITDRKRGAEFGPLVQQCDLVPALDKPYLFMNQSLRFIKNAISSHIDRIRDQITSVYPEIGKRQDLAQENLYICGPIVGDHSDRATKLAESKIYLCDPKKLENGVLVDLSGLQEYALFPGKVVCFGGKLIENEKFIAETLFDSSPPPVAPLDQCSTFPDRLAVVIACGPFTTADGFGYEPLVALLNYIQKHRPHVLILTGPIVPIGRDDTLTLPMMVQELFDRIVGRIVGTCSNAETQLVFGASADEASNFPCYPTPPSSVPQFGEKLQPWFCSDPSLVRIGGLLFGITSTDVLLHLSSEELFKTAATDGSNDRMARLINHLLSQQTFYPILPSPRGMNLDAEHWLTYAKIPMSPHILVLPSRLKPFVKSVGDVLVINPGHLAKGNVGGSFCRLEFDRRKLAHESGNVMRCIRSQIVRI